MTDYDLQNIAYYWRSSKTNPLKTDVNSSASEGQAGHAPQVASVVLL